MIYMVSSLFTCIKLAALQPYETKYQNRVELGNEINVLLVGYLACQLLYSSHSPEMMNNVGLFMVIVIMGSVAINLLFVSFFMLKETKNKFLNCKKKRAEKRISKKLSELDQFDSQMNKHVRQNRMYSRRIVRQTFVRDLSPIERKVNVLSHQRFAHESSEEP